MIINLIIPVMVKYNYKQDDLEKNIDNLKKINILINKTSDSMILNLSNKELTFRVFDNGIVVFNYSFECESSLTYLNYLEIKEKITNEFLNKNGEFVSMLKRIDSFFSNFDIKNNYFFNNKYVSYCLTTYYITDSNKALALSLALKRNVETGDADVLKEDSLKIVNIDNDNSIYLIWGARIFVSNNTNRDKDYQDYIKYESEAQQLWFLITAINKKIDEYMKSEDERPANISLLLDKSYDVLYSKSKFDTVVNSRVHRYELEIMQSIILASKIDLLEQNLERKIELLKEKSQIINNKLEKKNSRFVNILLIFISFLSSTSTIYGFVSVFIGESNKQISYIVIVIFVIILFGLGYVLKDRASRGKNKRKK